MSEKDEEEDREESEHVLWIILPKLLA